MSLQYTFSFSKNITVLRLYYGNPFAPIQSLFAGVLRAKPVSIRAAGNFCKITSDRALNRPRSPEVRKPLVYFWYFSYTRKVRKTFLLQEVSRFCKPRISTPQPQLRTATIKTFREIRGFANLESAHKNNNFPLTKLNPFAAFRRLYLCCCRNICRLRRLYSKAAISRRNVKKNSVAVTDTAKKSATGSAKNTAKVLSAKKFGKM